jgi:hypothetical protein
VSLATLNSGVPATFFVDYLHITDRHSRVVGVPTHRRYHDLRMRMVLNEEPWVSHLTSQLTRPSPFKFDYLIATRRVIHQYKWSKDAKKIFLEKYNIDA